MEIQKEADLQALIGESESIALEFKGPEDFQLWPQSKQNVTRTLSKEVSAFANTYGGQIIIGLKESRESPRRAESVEGVDPRNPPIETIQRLIEANIHPRLEGVRYQTIRLGGTNIGRVAYVISVPQGRTVHQANDKLYYGRSEYESVPLEDQLIRYKMMRERSVEATIDVVDVKVETALDEYQRRKKELEALSGRSDEEGFVYVRRETRQALEAPPREFDEYSFPISIKNIGTVTIRDCLLEVEIIGLPDSVFPEGNRWFFGLAAQNAVRTREEYGRQIATSYEAKLYHPAATSREPAYSWSPNGSDDSINPNSDLSFCPNRLKSWIKTGTTVG